MKIQEELSDDKAIKDYLSSYNKKQLLKKFSSLKDVFYSISYLNKEGIEEVKYTNGESSYIYMDLSSTSLYEKIEKEPNKVFITPATMYPDGNLA